MSNLQYIRSIAIGATRPSHAALLVFSLSLGSALASSIYLDAEKPVLFTIGGNFLLSLVALGTAKIKKIGHSHFTLFEKCGIAGILICNILWAITGNAWISLVAPTLVDAVGLGMVIVKLFKDKGSEDVFAWIMAALAYGISIAGLEHFNMQNLIYAGMNFILCGYIGCLSFKQRRTIVSDTAAK